MESKSACRCRCRDDGRPGCMCWCHTVPNDEAHPETCMVLRGGACDCGGAAPPDSLEKWAEDAAKWFAGVVALHPNDSQAVVALLARARALGVGRR